MNQFDELVVRYLETWNESDADKRRELIERHWSPDARYVDPLGEAVGPHAIDTMIAAVQDQFPGMRFSLAGPVDSHHRQARFGWNLGMPGSDPVIVGFDVAEHDAQGRLTSVLGFLDKVPS
ncbi:MAG: nuclear transport factor 2 family protein [Rhodococcus sp.]|nr:nuclear transport factor 2 family protein [Rhodococcus sp. (in: high G+C Gram-positive bacteria)]